MGESALFPTYARYPIEAVKGEGSVLWDAQGKQYIDLLSGIAVNALGHAPEVVKAALIKQLDELWHVSNLFNIPGQEKLASLLVEQSCFDHAFFCNSGAEANEAAIKLARRYHSLVLKKERPDVITFKQSFHGRTLATLAATGQEKIQEGYAPLIQGFAYAEYNNAETLESHITERTGAIMLELVQGEGGVVPADPVFIAEIKRLCEQYHLLLIIDEIQTGIGRTGTMFAYEQYDIEPDIMTLAKALGNGFPIGAMLGKAKLADAFAAGSHGSTFGGNPLACAAGLATLQTVMDEQLVQRAQTLGEKASSFLREQLADHPSVLEVRGRGLLIGIVCNEPVKDWIAALQEEGVLVLPAGPQVIRILPSLNVPEEQLFAGLELICTVLQKSLQSVNE